MRVRNKVSYQVHTAGNGLATSEGTADGFDPSALEELRTLADDAEPGFLAGIVRTYLEKLPGRVGAITDATKRGDLAAAAKEAHGLGGTSGMFGARRLRAICMAFEQSAGADAAAETASLLCKIRDECACVRERLERFAETV